MTTKKTAKEFREEMEAAMHPAVPLTPEERKRLFYLNSFILRPGVSRYQACVRDEEPPAFDQYGSQ